MKTLFANASPRALPGVETASVNVPNKLVLVKLNIPGTQNQWWGCDPRRARKIATQLLRAADEAEGK